MKIKNRIISNNPWSNKIDIDIRIIAFILN